MRVVEEEKNQKTEASPDVTAAEATYTEEKKHRKQRLTKQHRGRPFLRFVIALIILTAVIIACVAYLIFFVAGPLVKSVDTMPSDFPKSLALYQIDQAKIQVQLPENKERLVQLLSGLPAWTLEPFIDYLTTDLKTRLAAILKDPNYLPKNLTLSDLEKTLVENADPTKTVGLEWTNISKTKEELYDYYKKQLTAQGYTVKEKITDYEIDLSFFKPGVEGAMTIADSFMKDDNSILKMTINYLSGL